MRGRLKGAGTGLHMALIALALPMFAGSPETTHVSSLFPPSAK